MARHFLFAYISHAEDELHLEPLQISVRSSIRYDHFNLTHKRQDTTS